MEQKEKKFMIHLEPLTAKNFSQQEYINHRRSTGPEGVELLIEYLLDNLSEKVSLHELSRIVGLSSFHLVRVFRQETGFPPHTFLINARIEKAKELLAGGWSIAQTAYETGFADQSHFTRYFKRTVGITPKTYVDSYGS